MALECQPDNTSQFTCDANNGMQDIVRECNGSFCRLDGKNYAIGSVIRIRSQICNYTCSKY